MKLNSAETTKAWRNEWLRKTKSYIAILFLVDLLILFTTITWIHVVFVIIHFVGDICARLKLSRKS